MRMLVEVRSSRIFIELETNTLHDQVLRKEENWEKPEFHNPIKCIGNKHHYTCFFSVVFTPMQVS